MSFGEMSTNKTPIRSFCRKHLRQIIILTHKLIMRTKYFYFNGIKINNNNNNIIGSMSIYARFIKNTKMNLTMWR